LSITASLRSAVPKVAALQDANAIDKNANTTTRLLRRQASQAPELPTYTSRVDGLLKPVPAPVGALPMPRLASRGIWFIEP
jgi:hypothetical protein